MLYPESGLTSIAEEKGLDEDSYLPLSIL